MRFVRFAAVGAALLVAGCFDVDMNVSITGPDDARLNGRIEVARDMFNMMGGSEDFCPADEGGTLTMTDTRAQCDILLEGTFAEIFEPSDDGSPSPTAVDLGDGTVRVTFPLDAMTADTEEMRNDPNAVAMMRPMLEGYSVTLRVSGAEIVSTSGTMSEDGTSASVSFELSDLLDDDFVIKPLFETVVRY